MTADSAARARTDDEWADWLLEERFGGSHLVELAVKTSLLHWRNRVLQNARIRPGDTVLDVGTGDGLVGLGALGLVGAGGRVVFSDISVRLLDRCREVVNGSGMPGRCDYLVASAGALGAVPDRSVDVVTTRSVLMHLVDRQGALAEFHRVLRPGGRLSCFESMARQTTDLRRGEFRGYDVTPVQGLVDRVCAAAPNGNLTATPAMLSLDERQLTHLATLAGFGEVRLTLELEVDHPNPVRDWNFFWRVPLHPGLPTLEAAASAALLPSETDSLVAHLRPLVEAGAGVRRQAVAYLTATRRADC